MSDKIALGLYVLTQLMPGNPSNADFAAWVRQKLAGRNYREAAEEIGLHFTILYDLAKGRRKSRATGVRIAKGLGLSVNEALRMAGMEPESESGAAYFLRRLKALAEELGLAAIPVDFFSETGEPEEFTVEQADQLIASIRRQLTRNPEADG
jgi:ADP-ribose pyrophosphatase YjhB (NUDIX family)